MRAPRVLGLLILALVLVVLSVAEVPAQIPGVKVQPGGKPGVPPIPGPKVPAPPGKVPGPLPPPGGGPVDPKNPSGGTGSVPPGGTPGAPEKKKDFGKFPKEINGKTVDDCVREIRSNSDPVVRESAVRT